MEDVPIDLHAHHSPIRPGDFARVLLAAGGEPPRARARDQQADLVGEALRRRVLNRITVLDPEPEALESALMMIVNEFGEPSGATRAVCSAIAQEWEMVHLSPEFWPFLLGQAIEAVDGPPGSRRKRRRFPDETA